MKKTARRGLAGLAGCILLLPALVQVARAESGGDLALEEIMVTAQKRSENVQDVPISITVLDAEALKNTGTNSLSDLYASVPNFDFTNSGFLFNSTITIRGIISNDSMAGFETATGTVVDDVYVGRSAAFNSTFLDIERVEILRGPQGTLQGKNIIGGAINITTRRPTPEWTAAADITAGNYDLTQFRGYVSGPLVGDTVKGKLSATIRQRDGYTENTFTGNTVGNEDSQAVAVQFLVTPNESLEILFGGDYMKDDVRDNPTLYTAPFELADPLTPTVESRKVSTEFDSQTDRKIFGGFAKINYTLGSGIVLTSISGYRGFDIDSVFEQDGTPALLVNTGKVQEQRQFSQEFRITSPANERLRWIAGLYYFDETIEEQTRGAFFAFGADTIALADLDSESIAGFGSVTYDFSERFSTTAGLRYTHDEREFKGTAGYLGLAPFGIPLCVPGTGQAFCPFTGPEQIAVPLPIAPNSASEGVVTGDLTFNYKWTPSISTYFKYARGYKGGGFQTNLAAVTLGDEVDPEFVDSFEIGYRSMLMDNRVRLNATAFYMNWKDRQVQDFDSSPEVFTNIVRNDPKAISYGAEFDLTAQLSEAFTVEVNAALLHAEIKEGRITQPFPPDTILDGNEIPNAPAASIGSALQYRAPVASNLVLFARGELNWRDSYYLSSDNTYKTPSNTLLNARLGLESEDGRYGIFLWGKNLTDEDVVAGAGLVPLGPPNGPKLFTVLRDPRTFGVTVNVKY